MKPSWLIPAFLAGAIAGALVLRSILPHPPEPAAIAPMSTSLSPLPSPAPSTIVAAESPAVRVAAVVADARPPSQRADGASSSAAAIPVVTTAGGAAIDLSPALRDALAQHSFKTESPAELHEALEKESKDDSWSYPIEAEIRSSLAAISANDAVTVHSVECRSTLCEVRLSAPAYNMNLVQEWNREVGAYSWIRRVVPVTHLVTSRDGRAEALTILRRSPANAGTAP